MKRFILIKLCNLKYNSFSFDNKEEATSASSHSAEFPGTFITLLDKKTSEFEYPDFKPLKSFRNGQVTHRFLIKE